MVLKIKPPQVGRVNALVKSECCNCDGGNCLLLDGGEPCPCVQLLTVAGICCEYFRDAVLPADKKLYAEIIRQNYCPGEERKRE